MKHFYTSNYARSAQHPLAVAISASPPDWYHGKKFQLLAPTWEMINDYKSGRINSKDYASKYITLLEQRDITAFDIVEIFPDGTRFLCYEAPGDFCHRRVLADWIKERTGMEVTEFISEEQEKRDELANDLLEF